MVDQNANIDFSEVFKLAQNISKSQEQFSPPTLAPIDKATNNQQMRILKASLPYFDLHQQKSLAMAIKFLEFRRTMEFFNEPLPIDSPLYHKKELNTMELLTDIKNSCDEPHQKKLNLMIMMMNMQSTMETYKNNAKNLPTVPETKHDVPPSEDKKAAEYDQFMNMVNKIIEEKGGN